MQNPRRDEGRIRAIYDALMGTYGPQGWWPVSTCGTGNPMKTGSTEGYHPSDYSYPRTRNEAFEICLGAILTQNTAWTNVVQALKRLGDARCLDPDSISRLDDAALKEAIRPAGYYNQKARKVRIFTDFFLSLSGRVPSREELLSLWGIGDETADSMLLYAFRVPSFVIDAYTKRMLVSLGVVDEKATYGHMKDIFEKEMEPDPNVYQEYHALIVEHGKRFYSKKPYGIDDSLIDLARLQR